VLQRTFLRFGSPRMESGRLPSDTGQMRTRPPLRREVRAAVTAVVFAALLAPVLLDRDSFPLSTYPMYSSVRSGESTLLTARGVASDGSSRELTPTLIGDSDDPLVVVGRLRAALSVGRGDVRCAEIAERVLMRSEFDDVVVIEIASERHDTVARTLDQKSLIDREVRAACDVRRP
jgi:hypothetical protein